MIEVIPDISRKRDDPESLNRPSKDSGFAGFTRAPE